MYVLYNQKYYLMHNAIGQWTPTPELNESFQFNDKIKADTEALTKPLYELSSELYKQAEEANKAQGAAGGAQGAEEAKKADDDVVDAEVVDEDKK